MESIANRLAASYDQALNAVNESGDANAAAQQFVCWLAEHWARQLSAPFWPADAVSVDRNGTLIIR